MLPKKLQLKIDKRIEENALRSLGKSNDLIDFSSNDYLGFSVSEAIYTRTLEILKVSKLEVNGATGSRLLSGNHTLYETTEAATAKFHNTESALIFNSGYSANIGFFSSVPQRGDIILYDELCHASIREGIQLSSANAYKFKHNDLDAIEKQLLVRAQANTENEEIYVVTEAVFSMDGDQPDLALMIALCKKHGCRLIVDEAHAVGVINAGRGALYTVEVANDVFARIVTFGKAMGCHGAAILGSATLIKYLVNFTRSFIYTTGLPPHSVATIQAAYEELEKSSHMLELLNRNIDLLRLVIQEQSLEEHFISSSSAIHSFVIPGNDRVKEASRLLAENGFDVKAIVSPTVPMGQERLRLCVHSFNTEEEITKLIELIATFV